MSRGVGVYREKWWVDRGRVIAIEFNTADYIRQNNNNPYLQVATGLHCPYLQVASGLHCPLYKQVSTLVLLSLCALCSVQVSSSAVHMCRSLGLLSL